ncbi:MAG TPA: hypothetical protein VE870_17410 [Bacteroidales bacterium]|nr:hypothetical protein [Bacteroidales bacterium]
MKKILISFLLSSFVLIEGFCPVFPPDRADLLKSDTGRNPLKWPFSRYSIWNMPVGSGAEYVKAGLERSKSMGMTVDEDIIVLSPGSPMMEIYKSSAGWDRTKNRCSADGGLLFSAPVPADFIVSPQSWDGLTPNSGLAVLMPDGRTIKQTQPFAHCKRGKEATSGYVFSDEDIYGEGMYGAHGGSGLSAIGGTLRLGELEPGSGPIRHALKIDVFGKKNLYYDDKTKGFRWPALRADGYAPGNYGSERESEVAIECRMGALLALPKWMDLDSLGFETRPGRILAETFKNYGAYIVDDTAWDVYAIATEWSPSGRFTDKFQKNWGFPMTEPGKNTPWARDMDRIFLNLYVVNNNGPHSKGGGGTPLVPLASEITPP